MQTTTAHTLVTATPADAYAAICRLVARVWSVDSSDIVDERPGERLTHGVRLDGQTSCWLTWELSAVTSTTTHVRLVHDDADVGAAPPADLEGVLGMLQLSVASPRR